MSSDNRQCFMEANTTNSEITSWIALCQSKIKFGISSV
jgi:hypothetical protein